jgi:hypothetical protein
VGLRSLGQSTGVGQTIGPDRSLLLPRRSSKIRILAEPHLLELAELKLALALMAVRLDELDARRNRSGSATDPAATEIEKTFAQRAVLAMRHVGE